MTLRVRRSAGVVAAGALVAAALTIPTATAIHVTNPRQTSFASRRSSVRFRSAPPMRRWAPAPLHRGSHRFNRLLNRAAMPNAITSLSSEVGHPPKMQAAAVQGGAIRDVRDNRL
jgi:hypothetical protein